MPHKSKIRTPLKQFVTEMVPTEDPNNDAIPIEAPTATTMGDMVSNITPMDVVLPPSVEPPDEKPTNIPHSALLLDNSIALTTGLAV
jgi:hypothetical protein